MFIFILDDWRDCQYLNENFPDGAGATDEQLEWYQTNCQIGIMFSNVVFKYSFMCLGVR